MYSSNPVVLIPARNESATVGQVVRTVITKTSWPVVVIDDASTDDTRLVATLAGAIVLHLPFQLGAWGAIQTGIRYALSAKYDCAITMDADGQGCWSATVQEIQRARQRNLLVNWLTSSILSSSAPGRFILHRRKPGVAVLTLFLGRHETWLSKHVEGRGRYHSPQAISRGNDRFCTTQLSSVDSSAASSGESSPASSWGG